MCHLAKLPVSGSKAQLFTRLQRASAKKAKQTGKAPSKDDDDDYSDESQEGDRSSTSEEEGEREYGIVAVKGFRVINKQEQHRIHWEDGDVTWETCDTAHAAWDIKPPYETPEKLQPLLNANKAKYTKKKPNKTKTR
jgi:hypothetical protein